MAITSILETVMLVCFGFSWPINIYKAWKARTAKGTSVLFYYLIDLGYVAGAAAKLIMIFSSIDPWYVTVKWYVITIYIINFLMVSTGILIYYRNRALDEKAAKAA